MSLPTAEDGRAELGEVEKEVLQVGPLVQDVDEGLAVHNEGPLIGPRAWAACLVQVESENLNELIAIETH